MPKQHDWKKLDDGHRWNYKDWRLEIAQKLGYKYISESIVKTYRKEQSCAKTAEILKVHTCTIRTMLHQFKEPTRGPGGANRGLSVPVLWQQKTFDESLFKLGEMCKYKHDWNNTGKSLRQAYYNPKTGHRHGFCTMCRYLYNTEFYRKKKLKAGAGGQTK